MHSTVDIVRKICVSKMIKRTHRAYHCKSLSVWCLSGHFVLIGGGQGLPVVAFALKTGRKNKEGNDISYDEFDIMDRMKEYHWQLPAYNLPKNAE